MFVYYLNECHLPWEDLDCTNIKEYFAERNSFQMIDRTIEWLPVEFRPIAREILKLRFDQRPPYEEFYELLKCRH